MRDPEAEPTYLPAFAPVVDHIAKLGPGQVVLLEIAAGAGKTRVMAAAVSAFLDREPGRRALIVTHSLTITQQAAAIEAYRTSVTLIRDKEEMRAWLYHPDTPTNRVVVVTESLIGSTAAAALLDSGFGLTVFADTDPRFIDFAATLSVHGSAVVLIGHPANFRATQQARNSLVHATVLPTPSLQDLVEPPPHAPVRRVGFPVGHRERDTITEAVALVPETDSEVGKWLRTAALSSRAALSAALVSLRMGRREPSAMKRDHPGRTLPTNSGALLSDEQVLHRTSEAPDVLSNLPASRLDAILDVIDDLGEDRKLLTLARLLTEVENVWDTLVLFVQNSATARYVEQFLTDHVSGVQPTLWTKSHRIDLQQRSLFDDRYVLIVTDRDLVYLGDPLTDCTYVWFDVPSTPRHGRRRISLSDSGGGLLYVLMAEPPLLDEPSRLHHAGLPHPAAPPSTGNTER
ncbi:DEAD/DEAH box helicase family protein [Streptomyces sp. NPDC051362]|uniref:DEAD/DEAH box helicase family protein n=1 Tax=Streptomyces sp. NPDC051362 TaxID=3365651 RepID=UPI0037878A82